MALVNLTSLDFEDIKTSIKDYLRSNSNFTDYDFEGSNISVIIDMLAYNTYISSYNANMVSNEVFIDSATLRENIVSLARNIGYIPQSRKSARANISFFVEGNTNFVARSLTLKKGIIAVSNAFNGANYTFSLLNDVTVPVSSDRTANFNNIDIYEGTLVTTSFTVNPSNPNQRFILDNQGIDTSTIQVSVSSQNSNSFKKYLNATNILNVTAESTVFFLQEIEDERYELIFGDGVFGKKLSENDSIEINYIISNGENGNGASSFSFTGTILSNNNSIFDGDTSIISVNATSSGGSEIESVNSIRTFAPRLYSSQNRAVTASDYETIIPKIYPETESVTAFGGEDLNPPQFGKVFITIKPFFGTFISNSVKNNIRQQLKKFSVSGISPVILDAKILYIELDTNVYYDSNVNSRSSEIQTKINDNVVRLSKSQELNKYGAKFRYSRYQKLVDNTDSSITSNITKIQIRRDIQVQTNIFAEYELCFKNNFHISNRSGFNIKSSGFRVSGISNVVYFGDIPNADLKTGTIFLFYLNFNLQPVLVKNGVGTVDYTEGEILTTPLKILSTLKTDGGSPIIQISASPESNDIFGVQDLYLQLDTSKLNITMIPDNLQSGSDSSGSNEIISSSYPTTNLIIN